MTTLKSWWRIVPALAAALPKGPAVAADLAEIKARGEIQHLGINHANCVTGADDGFDVELVPALLKGDADFTLLDVPDALLDLQMWAGQIKIIIPVSEEQELAAAFLRSAPMLRQAFDVYPRRIRGDGSCDKLVDKY